MRENLILVSGAVVFRRLKNGKQQWLIIKQSKDSDWEIPKVIVRKGESSVRAAIRYMAETGGMNARVLEEAGRFGGSASINGKIVPRRYLYYLMMQRSSGEALGFEELAWFDYKKAQRKLALKKEKEIVRNAHFVLKEWLKKRSQKK